LNILERVPPKVSVGQINDQEILLALK